MKHKNMKLMQFRSDTTDEKKRNFIFILAMILMAIYLIWRMVFTLPFEAGVLNVIAGLLLIIAETVTVLTTFELFLQKMKVGGKRLECPEVPPEYYPDVDVFIATHNESVDLLYKTVNACTFMDYPDKKKVHIYLCDDGNRLEVAELAKQFGVGYLGLADNKHAKSGNLNHAMSKTSSPFIATFDADMIPQHTFLMKTIPYFLLSKFIKEEGIWRLRKEGETEENLNLALIQTPQSFYNPDLFQFNLHAETVIPNEQDFFSREINILRNASNSVAYTGSNTVLLRSAMEEIGGFPINTITEDFETSIRLQQAGYITYATDEVQAAGLTTTTLPSMIKQRIRWARGIIQSLQNTKAIFSKKLPIDTRITYLCSFLYWWSFLNRLIFILSPILFALFDFQIVETDFWSLLIFWLPAYFFYSISMRYLSSNIRNQRWSQVIDTIFMPYLIWPTLLETLHIRETTFRVTNKDRHAENKWYDSLKYAVPHLFLLALSIAAIIRFVSGKYGWALLFSSVIIFWLSYNMVALFYALFFMFGRHAYRDTERIRAKEKVSIRHKNRVYQAETVDVSEKGIAFHIPEAIYLPKETEIALTVTTKKYKAELEASIVYVRPEGEGWRYSATVDPVSEEDKRQYMQIIYDRHHSLPQQMNSWNTAYDDMVRNVKKRIVKPFFDQRKAPRIPIKYKVVFEDGSSCVLRSFNYYFFSATDFQPSGLVGDTFVFYTEGQIQVVVKRTGRINSKAEELLSVENLANLDERGLLEQLRDDLLNSNSNQNHGQENWQQEYHYKGGA